MLIIFIENFVCRTAYGRNTVARAKTYCRHRRRLCVCVLRTFYKIFTIFCVCHFKAKCIGRASMSGDKPRRQYMRWKCVHLCVSRLFSHSTLHYFPALGFHLCCMCQYISDFFLSCSFLGFSQRSRFPHEYMPICVCADTFLVRVYAIFQIVMGHFQLEPWRMDSFCRFALSVSPACCLFSIFPLPVSNRQ